MLSLAIHPFGVPTKRAPAAHRQEVANRLKQYWLAYQRAERDAGRHVTQAKINADMGWGEGNGMFYQLLHGLTPLNFQQATMLANRFGCTPEDFDPTFAHLRKPASDPPGRLYPAPGYVTVTVPESEWREFLEFRESKPPRYQRHSGHERANNEQEQE